MEDLLFSTGSDVFDTLLKGYEGGVVTTVYGPSGSGKTTVCLLATLACLQRGKKVIFVDTEGGFSTVRFRQLLGQEDLSPLLDQVFLLKPMTFADQRKTVARLKDLVNDSIGLIVIDSISMLYRVALARHEGIKGINAELGLQVNYLTQVARKFNIPILLTSQVYADFDVRDNVKMVGGDILKYGSKCLVALRKYKTLRRATIVKHRSLPEDASVVFSIDNGGFALFEEPQAEPTPVSVVEEKKEEEKHFESADSL